MSPLIMAIMAFVPVTPFDAVNSPIPGESPDLPILLDLDELDFGVSVAAFDGTIPRRIRSLDGKWVRIHGRIEPIPSIQATYSRFPLEGETKQRPMDFFATPFETWPVHLIWIRVRTHSEIDIPLGSSVQVTGRFRVEEMRDDDGQLAGLFHIDSATVIPTEPRPGYGRVWYYRVCLRRALYKRATPPWVCVRIVGGGGLSPGRGGTL